MDNEIWVWAEHEQGEIRESSLEMLGEARRLASRLKGKVCAFLLGENVSRFTDKLVAYGSDVVYLFEDRRLNEFSADLYTHAFSKLKIEHSPMLVLIAATPNGASLAPRLAARLKSGFAANTVTIAVQQDNSLRINRSTCLGKAHGVFTFAPNSTTVVTMKPGSVGLDRAVNTRKGDIVAMQLGDMPMPRTEVKGFVKADPKVVALDEAERIVAAGYGFHQKQNLDLIWNLSDVMGAAVGGSKPTVDNGWLPRNRLVGESSGRRLSPRLFMAIGVSGTSYFIGGMKDSRLIIAINSDKGAPIMKLADLAAVGDLREVLPVLIEQIRKRQAVEAQNAGNV
ncbi:MAG: electron transfer flavoprotein subunit alpha/FixB family protein [Dehalococcoidia bacterium]|nr:electron transfer flavoprotein subunit alpha/FixB family protein [Dehalococcoidia bacterium]